MDELQQKYYVVHLQKLPLQVQHTILYPIICIATMIKNLQSFLMLLPGVLELWKRQRHGRIVQVKSVVYITERLETMDLFVDILEDTAPYLAEIIYDCKSCATPNVSMDTLQRWWNIYQEWIELPYNVVERKKALKGNNKYAKENKLLNNPNYYLDELALLFGAKTGKVVHYSTICCTLKEMLDCSFQGVATIAWQQSEDEEAGYLLALNMLL